MAMCKECGQVVGADDIENGICKSCIVKGVKADFTEKEDNTEAKVSNFGNPFSFKGKSGRLDYLLYGVLLSYALVGLGFYFGVQAGNLVVFYGALLVAIIISIAATVRRTRDRGNNIIVVLILALIPYLNIVVMVYLLLAPGKEDGKPSNIINIIVGVAFAIVLIGILAAVAMPKLLDVKNAKAETTCIKMKDISRRLDMFKLDNNTYPSTEDGIRILVYADSKYLNYRIGGYMKKIPTDPFGNEFLYHSKDNGEFEILSYGEDGQRGSADDIAFSGCGN